MLKSQRGKKNKLAANTLRVQKGPSTSFRGTLTQHSRWVGKSVKGCPKRIKTGPHPVPARPPRWLRKRPWLGGQFVPPVTGSERTLHVQDASSGRQQEGPGGHRSGPWTLSVRRPRCAPRRGFVSNFHPSQLATSGPALTRTKTTTARRSRNSQPNGTRLPEASSTGSWATAAASGCRRSGPLGSGAAAVRLLTCRVTGARAGAAIPPNFRGPGLTPARAGKT